MNTNCLEGMQCPKCQSLEPFTITAGIKVLVYDAGTEDLNLDYEWEDNASCACEKCDNAGRIADFKTANGGAA